MLSIGNEVLERPFSEKGNFHEPTKMEFDRSH